MMPSSVVARPPSGVIVNRASTVAAAAAAQPVRAPTPLSLAQEQLKRLDAQLGQMRAGLSMLQRRLLERQRVLLTDHVNALLPSSAAAKKPAATTPVTTPVTTAPPAATATTPSAPPPSLATLLAPLPAASAAAPPASAPGIMPPPWTVDAVIDLPDLPALTPEVRLSLATSVAALQRIKRRLDPDATDSSSGESGPEDDGPDSDDDNDNDKMNVDSGTSSTSSSSAVLSEAAPTAPRTKPSPRAIGPKARTAQLLANISDDLLERSWRAHDRNQFLWRQQWLRLQLLDLDSRINNTPLTRQLNERQVTAVAPVWSKLLQTRRWRTWPQTAK